MMATIEGNDISTPDDFHDIVARALAFPEHYGRNLDALWDCLTGWIDTPTTIVWKNYEVSRARLGEYAERVVKVILEAAEEVEGLVLRLE